MSKCYRLSDSIDKGSADPGYKILLPLGPETLQPIVSYLFYYCFWSYYWCFELYSIL